MAMKVSARLLGSAFIMTVILAQAALAEEASPGPQAPSLESILAAEAHPEGEVILPGQPVFPRRGFGAEVPLTELPEGAFGHGARGERQASGAVMLNFNEASLRDILRTVADITGENFILSPGINARISVQTTKPIQRRDVLPVFESILEVNGLTAVRTGQFLKIVPAASARQRRSDLLVSPAPSDIPEGDRIVNLVVPVEFVSATDLLQVIRPMLSPAGSAVNYPKTNTLVITDIASGVKGVLELIEALDIDAFERMRVSFVEARHVSARSLHRELSEILSAMGLGKDATQVSIIPVERLNSLIILTPSAELYTAVTGWMEKLDRTAASDGASVHIYYVQNDKASNIKNLLAEIYGGRRPAMQAAQHPAEARQPQPRDGAQKADAWTGSEEVKIHIYEPTNALIIQASQADYLGMLPAIKELDRPPKQVLIDALIAEIKLDESTRFGIQWSALAGNASIQQNTGLFSPVVNNPAGPIVTPIGAAAPTGLSVFATDASKFFGAIQALATTGKVNVLSNPHITVKNYEKASINVGTDEPVATQSTQTAVTGTGSIIQNIEYRKTGVILTVVPQITEGGMVAMTIRQEVSDKSTDRTVGNAVYPSFTKREAETSVVAKDRETLVIGGLIQDKTDRTRTGIPFLSKVPLLGALFSSTTKTDARTELIVLLTPRVIGDPEQAASVTDSVRSRLESLKGLIENGGIKPAP